MKGLITIDIEGGSQPDPYRSVDRLEELLDQLSIPATLFITPDVVENRPEVVARWLDQNHTIGLHIHPERLTDGGSDWLSEYDEESIEELLVVGCETFADYLGFEPDAFRAGRWEYSDQLLRALHSQGFVRDASLRPDRYREPYTRSGIEEMPMTVYDSVFVRQLLRPWNIDTIPLHADAFLRNRLFIPGFYALTERLLRSSRPYLMVSFHDYDTEPTYQRIIRYVSFIDNRTTLSAVGRH